MLVLIAAGISPILAADSRNTATSGRQVNPTGIDVRSFLPEKPLSRARRPSPIAAAIANVGTSAAEVHVRLILPTGVRLAGSVASQTARIEGGDEAKLLWQIEADAAGPAELRLEVSAGSTNVATASLPMLFLPPLEQSKPDYIPAPTPVRTPLLIGAHHCPLWEVDKTNLWANVRKHPERTPALGFYAQENPEVSDWETKWAVEHGINFFVYCWYRASQGGPVTMRYGSAIHDALFKSRFAGQMKFTIMWENQSRGKAGVADERDLMTNLLPFWITNYFQHPGYLKVDNRPLLFIYRPEFLVKDLGSVANVKQAFEKMRLACREAGFAGLYLLGEYRGLDPKHLTHMRDLGLDYTFAYCWHIQNNPTPAQAIAAQMQNLKKTQELGILPQVPTVSQAWSGWRDEGSIWKIPPRDFETLLRQARDFMATLPAGELGSRLLLLDNWNEWGEGHYLAPYREYGFGYVDAVRNVFANAPEPHVDLIPEDIGRGPYDTAYWSQMRRAENEQKLVAKRVRKAGAPEDGLIGWWAFDEPADSAFTFDYSGNRLGGKLLAAGRTNGVDGNALVCQGGCAVIKNHRLLSPTNALTIECWVKTGVSGQANNWLVNRVLAGGTSTGYRLGIVQGKPCFEVPVTDWSHHLQAPTPLPPGRWVHLAGTFDGKVMTIYVDGEPRGTMNRTGPIKPNQFDLCLGSYTPDHPAHFAGLLDEVRLYSRALTADEVRSHYRRLAGRGGPDKSATSGKAGRSKQ